VVFDEGLTPKTSKPSTKTISSQPDKTVSENTRSLNTLEKTVKRKSIQKDKKMSNVVDPRSESPSLSSGTTDKAKASEKASETVDENISFACRMGMLKRIKIRDHYIQKIENLYDSKCKKKEKQSKMTKALSIYKEKYHKLRQDHSFYTKLCKQYGVAPGEEYVGVDPDIQPDDSDQGEEKMNNAFTSKGPSFLSNVNPTTVTKQAIDKPHRNPFDQDTIKEPEKLATTGFKFSGENLFTKPSSTTVKRKRPNESSSSNLFQCTPNVNKPDLFSLKKDAKNIAASTTTNPFSPAATKVKSGSLFFNSAGGNTKNLFSTTNNVTKPSSGSLFGLSNTSGTASMDSDLPIASGSNGFVPAPKNPFAVTASNNGKIGNLGSNNAFTIQQSNSTSLFGSSTQGNANPFTNAPTAAFGNQGGFNPGIVTTGKFSLGNLGGQNKKRRPVVRGRRTLK